LRALGAGDQGVRRRRSLERFAARWSRRYLGQSRLRAQGPHTCSDLLALGRSETMEIPEFVAVPVEQRKADEAVRQRPEHTDSFTRPSTLDTDLEERPGARRSRTTQLGVKGSQVQILSSRQRNSLRCRSSGVIFGWPLLCVRARIGSPRPLPVLPSLPSDAGGGYRAHRGEGHHDRDERHRNGDEYGQVKARDNVARVGADAPQPDVSRRLTSQQEARRR
jgi:hypothetical protein